MRQRPPLLSLRTAATAVAVLAGCVLALALYGTCAVLAGLPEAIASAVALAGQGAWQAGVLRGLHRAGRWVVALQGLAAVGGFLLGGLLGYSAGASASFSVATSALVVLPAAAVAGAWWAAPRRVAAGALRTPRAALHAGSAADVPEPAAPAPR